MCWGAIPRASIAPTFLWWLPVDGVEILAGTRPGASIRGDNACFSYFSALRDPLIPASIGDRGINFKASATASSYVILQQELARGLRLSQPGRVAKDAALGELLGLHPPIASPAPLGLLMTPFAAAAARQSLWHATRDCCSTCARERAPSPQERIRDDARHLTIVLLAGQY